MIAWMTSKRTNSNVKAHDWLLLAMEIRTNSCIPWPYSSRNSGRVSYPAVNVDGRIVGAHVVACEHGNGPKPDDNVQAAHSCHNTTCVNPRHLRWTLPVENVADRMIDGTRHPFVEVLPAHARLTPKQIADLRRRYLSGAVTQQQLAEKYNVSQATISRYLHGYAAQR
jgi:hypothetical protein